MKKLSSLLLALFAMITITAQLTVQVQSPGVVKLTYGATGDYTLYNPNSAATFWAHVWTNAGDNSTGTGYDDSWTNSNVTMNWDSAANAYVGTINFNTKVFTNGNKTLPAGTTINNFGFVLKNQQNGATQQSGDFSAITYGFTSTTTTSALGVSNNNLGKKSSVVAGMLYTAYKENVAITVYEMSGKLVKSFTAVANGNAIDLNVSKSGIYLVKISTGTTTEVVKFAK